MLYIKDFVHLAMQFAFTYAKLFNLFLTQVEVKHSMGKERNPCASHWLEFQQYSLQILFGADIRTMYCCVVAKQKKKTIYINNINVDIVKILETITFIVGSRLLQLKLFNDVI